jgi:hypothetical protein
MATRKKYCIVHSRGKFEDEETVGVYGPYSKREAIELVGEFSRDGTRGAPTGDWEMRQVVPYFDVGKQ